MKNNKQLTIYDVGVHVETGIPGATIMRVPGGWIYTIKADWNNVDSPQSSVFVPCSDEFKERES